MADKYSNFIYFNLTYDKLKDYKVSLTKEYKEYGVLEKIKEIDLIQQSGPLITKVYRFKLLPNLIEFDGNDIYKIDISIEDDENQAKYIYSIRLKNKDKDFYEYNFKIEELDILPLSYDEQFDIYIDILRKIYKKIQKTKENEDLIFSTQLLLKEKDSKYDFLFYLKIFLECFSINLLQDHLLLFDPNRIKGIGELSEKKFRPLSNVINQKANNPEGIYFSSEESKQQTLEMLYSIVLFYNLHFQKDKIHELFENEKSFNFLIEKLANFKNFFKDLILPESEVTKLLEKAKEFHQIVSFLSYVERDVLKFFDFLDKNKNIILDCYKKEINNKDKKHKNSPYIDIESYVEPKINDDIQKISVKIKSLLESKDNYIKISSNFIEKYIDFNNGINLYNLLYIKEIINCITKVDKNFKYKYKIEKIIHENFLLFVQNRKMKNIEILDFIQKDEYYTNKNHKKGDRSLDIFDGIEIETIDNNFFNNWKTINFVKIFDSQFTEFLEKIASLIKEMKYFSLIFSFYEFSKEKDYTTECVTIMQKRYKEIFHTYIIEECPNFLEETCKLIHLSDKKKAGVKKFNEELQKLLDVNSINNIYIYLTENYDNLSKELSNLIVKFFTTDKQNANPNSLILLIEKCKKLRGDILSNIDKYIIKNEEEFFYPENQMTVNYKFYRNLVKKDLLKKTENDKSTYILETMLIITSLQNKLKNLDINYKTLIYFFEEDNQNPYNQKLGKELEEKISFIFTNEKEVAKDIFNKINIKMKDIIEKIKFFDLILNYLNKFYPNTNKKDIENILKIVYNLKNNSLNFYENHYIKDHQNYQKYVDEAKKREKMGKSEFFNMICKDTRKKNPIKDKKFIEEIDKTFNKIQNIFKDKGIFKIDEKLLQLCFEPFKENEDSLDNEIKILSELFNVKEEAYDKGKLKEEIILISKKEYIFNIASSILSFIDKIGAKKTEILKVFISIVKDLKKQKDIIVIKRCKENLKNLKIDIDDKNNNYIDILIRFKLHPEIIPFLFKKTIEDCRNLQEILSENENSFVTANDILDLEKCIVFMKGLGKLEELKNKNDIEVIHLFKDEFSKKNDIFIYFTRLLNNYAQIELLLSHLDKSESLKYKLNVLFNNTTFILQNTQKDSFQCIYFENNKKEKMEKELVIALRERALLSKIITPQFKNFIETISEIINLDNTLKNIFNEGYPKKIKVQVELIKKIKKFRIDEKDYKIYNEVIEKLNNLLSEIKTNRKNGYEEKDLIRYIYGRQFNLIYKKLNKIEDNKNIEHLLKYITNDLYSDNLENFQIEQKGEIDDCYKYLKEVLNKNNLNLEKIYEKSIIKKTNEKQKYDGIYIYKCEKLEKDLYQIYKYLTNNNPVAQNILLCKKETINEEIISFMYRAIRCKYNSCFIIGGIELLEFEQKLCLIDLLNNFFPKGNEKINSCLIFLYTNKSSDIYKNLEMKKYKQILDLKRNIFENINYDDNDIEIIKSDKSGVGKSTQIKKEIEDKGKKWIYFPFGGVLKHEEIIERLKELVIGNNCVLHLDLYNTEQISLMMEFLFSILITRFYGQNEDIFFLSKKIPIKIEIPNTFIDFFEKFPILTLFKIKEMKISNLSPLIVPRQINSNIQIVANYLKALKEKKINYNDLFFTDITPIEFKGQSVTLKKTKEKKEITIDAEILSEEECKQLIFDTIKEKIPEPTYYQIISFINVLAIQLKKFNQNYFLNAYQLLCARGGSTCMVRTFIVESFIKLTKYFTEGAFTNLLNRQKIVHEIVFGQYDENKDINNAVNELANNKHEEISFEKIDPSLIFFHEGTGQNFSIITIKSKSDKEYIDLLALRNSQEKNSSTFAKELPNYKKYKQKDFLKELKDILGILNPVEKDSKSERKSLEEIAGNYVFTADNFVKMILILIRLRSNIPVIMMGETGCGKTALIRKLSEMKNNGSSDKMKILNIHAGTTDKDIINFIKNKVIPEALEIIEQEREEKEKCLKIGLQFEDTKIWVFLDEINTCKSMGLISELMCKHTYYGKELPSNIVFIAACNPYRQREKKQNIKNAGLDINFAYQQKKFLNDKELEDINRAKNNDLVYIVNPLPHSLLNFVFDFGSLKDEDEKDYINCIIKETLENIYYKRTPKKEKEDEKLKRLKLLASDMITAAQKYIRKYQDKSAVSLREIRRFNIFYTFFCSYLLNRKESIINTKENQLDNEDNDFYLKLDDYSLQVYGIILSIFVSYYLRITNKEQRNGLCIEMNNIFKSFDKLYKEKDFLELPLKEEKFIINNIKIDKGIAKNRALLENIFSLFVAINTNVPIFIVGKPGCSKSLSVQLLIKSMLGKNSDSSLFKNLPKIMLYSYQGSISSTSKGVENVFNKARNEHLKLDEENKRNNIPLIFFDEMGLAEHSPNNPLKVIHSELEYDQNKGEKMVAFVGISNWILDAAKMNRGLSISILEPDEEDNKETAVTIGKSFDEVLAERNKKFYENLGTVYFSYKKFLKEKYNLDSKEDFHGNRDFYHLVKNSARNIIIKEKNNQLNEQSLMNIAIKSIERNFSGMQFEYTDPKDSQDYFIKLFKEIYPNFRETNSNILDRIRDNINDLDSRYLLVISKSSLSNYLLSSLLNKEDKEINLYFGSKFKEDLNTEEYTFKVLNKIQSYMERKNILILKNLDSVYPALYDLFNQNFTIISNKNYARLAVGSNTNTFAYINKEFRCIIIVDYEKIGDEEPPFLNRFEKQILSLDYLFDEELINESKNIKSILDDLVIYNKEIYKRINYDLSKLLINCNIDEIQCMIYQMNKQEKNKNDTINYILSKIALVLPKDILVNMRISGFMQKYSEYSNKIIEFYEQGEHSNFANYLRTINNYKNVVYTFSNNLEKIKNIKNISNNLLDIKINEENIKEINISSLKSESDFERNFDEFYKEPNQNICIIKLMPFESDFMEYIQCFIDNKEKELKKKKDKKVIIFIVYMTRILNNDLNNLEGMPIKEQNEIKKKMLNKTLSSLSDYYQIFIDNLNGESEIKIHEIIKVTKPYELLTKCFDLDKELYNNILKSISYMKYNIISPYKGINKNTYVDKLINFISKNEKLKKMMNECIAKQIQQKGEDIISKIFKEENNQEIFIDILTIIENYIYNIYISELNLLFFKAEKDQLFSSLLSIEEDNDKNKEKKEYEINLYNEKDFAEKISQIYFDHLILNDNIIKITKNQRANNIEIVLGLNMPGIKPLFNNILKYIKDNIIKKYRINENNLRDFLEEEEEIEEAKRKYFQELNAFNDSISNLIIKEPIIRSIIDNNKVEKKLLYNLLINDYFTIYINNNFKKKRNKIKNKIQEKLIDNINNNKRFLNLIINMRNNIVFNHLNKKIEDVDIAMKLSNDINWIESYTEEIDSIQQIFFNLNLHIPEFNVQIEKIINEKQIKYEISPRNPEYTSIVNEIFFLSLDSILRVITSKEEIYELPSQDFFELINTCKDILQDALQLQNNLNMRSKEVFSLQEIMKLIDTFNEIKKVEKEKIDIIKKVIHYFSVQTACNNEKRQKKLIENLNDFIKFLFEKLEKENKNNNYKLLGFLFTNEYIKIVFNSFRVFLLDKILENNDFIKNSSGIMKIILENYIDNNPLEMVNNLNLLKEDNNAILKKINNTKNVYLDEVLMNIFEGKINVYFESIINLDLDSQKEYYNKYFKDNINSKEKNETGIVFDNSLEIFKQTIEFLDLISSQNETNKNEENIHLCKLYSIVYIKIYLNKLIYFVKEMQSKIGNISCIMKVIQGIKNNNFGKVIKIYIFKLLYSYYNNFELFKKFDFKNSGISFFTEFPTLAESGGQIMLKYFFLPLDNEDYKKYLEESKIFDKIRENKFRSNPSELSKLIKENGLNIFLDITINKIISEFALNYSEGNNEEYKIFSEYIKDLFNSIEDFSNELKELLFLLYENSIYAKKIRPKLLSQNGIINLELFESLLYGFKYCVNSLNHKNSKDEILYTSFFKKDGINLIDKSYLPGIDVIEDYHLITLDDVESHFQKYPDDNGCYVCSCGFYYNIEPCGFPTEGYTFGCPICSKPLGYGKKKIDIGPKNHGMERRKGHLRIFKNEKQKKIQMEKFGDHDLNIPNMILKDYKREIIDLINENSAGFNEISKKFFENQNKNIRKLSIIGYRLLNYIIYCHLFFAYCLGYISEDNLKKRLIQDMDIINIINTNWNLLKQSLQKKNINSIQIFMNIIFNKVSNIIKKYKNLTEKDRDNLEEDVEKLIEECIKNYPNLSSEYNEKNKNEIKVDKFDIKSIICELISISKENYPEKDYPMLKYFNLTKYKTIEDFIKRMEKKEKYPLINQILNENSAVNKMEYLLSFNEFTNFMVENYSFKISRDEAKKRILQNEEIYKTKEFKDMFKSFIKVWDNIKAEAIKYGCRDEMPKKDLSEKDCLVYFLNDCGEEGGGMYLAAACQNFISWQNTFLTNIKDANTFNGILKCYINNIKKIPLQEAKYSQIILIKKRFSKSNYKDIKDLIYTLSERNIFNENGEINYSEYNSFIYDYETIEEELGKIILPGVCLFDSETKLNFVTYWSEGFRGGKSQILSEFYEKYPQNSLNDYEKKKILKYINKKNKENINGYDFKEFFGSLQIIIFYLNEKNIEKKDEKFIDFLKKAPGYLKISNDCKEFFLNEGNNLTIDKIMNIFFFIEHLCFKDLVNNLQQEYKEKIPQNIKEKIESQLLNKENYLEGYYTIEDLGAAIRRFISRYIVGKTQEIDIKLDRELAFELSRIDLWEPKIANIQNFEDIITNQFKDIKLTVAQAYELYILIGKEDMKSINNKENE